MLFCLITLKVGSLLQEEAGSDNKVGTTIKGNRSSIYSWAARVGIRIADLWIRIIS